MEWIANYFATFDVATCVELITNIGMILTAIFTVIITIRSKINMANQTDIEAKTNTNMNKFKAEILTEVRQITNESTENIRKNNEEIAQLVIDKMTAQEEAEQQRIEETKVSVNKDLEVLKEIQANKEV